jgi:hypothetical protein
MISMRRVMSKGKGILSVVFLVMINLESSNLQVMYSRTPSGKKVVHPLLVQVESTVSHFSESLVEADPASPSVANN